MTSRRRRCRRLRRKKTISTTTTKENTDIGRENVCKGGDGEEKIEVNDDDRCFGIYDYNSNFDDDATLRRRQLGLHFVPE